MIEDELKELDERIEKKRKELDKLLAERLVLVLKRNFKRNENETI